MSQVLIPQFRDLDNTGLAVRDAGMQLCLEYPVFFRLLLFFFSIASLEKQARGAGAKERRSQREQIIQGRKRARGNKFNPVTSLSQAKAFNELAVNFHRTPRFAHNFLAKGAFSRVALNDVHAAILPIRGTNRNNQSRKTCA